MTVAAMAPGRLTMPIVALASALATWPVCGQPGEGQLPPEMANSAVGKKATRLAKSEPYIKCDVCTVALGEVWRQVEEAAAKAPYGELGELAIGEKVEAACDPDADEGEWMTFYDVVQAAPSEPLELKKEAFLGECRRECTTIMHACHAVIDEHREDMGEMLYKHTRLKKGADERPSKQGVSLTSEKFISRVCKKLAGACPGKPVPKGFAHKDERWMPADEEGHRMRKMQHNLNKQAQTHGSQKVQFLDPMGAMFNDMDDGEL